MPSTSPRTVLATLAALACLLAVPALARADSVTGSAHDCTLPDTCPSDPTTTTLYIELFADAHSGPAGETPTGTVRWGERIMGGAGFLASEDRVTCLAVNGRSAVIGVAGTTNLVRFGFTVWNAGLIRVTDGGGAGSKLDTFEFDVEYGPIPVFPIPPPPPPPDPTDCSSFPAGQAVQVNEQGDLVVDDIKPLPTSKDQCKGGGWRSYGVFKNQGACVSFVNRGSLP
jgi:hypothetical protein